MSEHKLASAADFRNDVNEEDCYEPAREVFLPKSEKWVLLRRPKPLAYTLLGAPLPGIPQERTGGEEADIEAAKPSASEAETLRQELLQVASWAVTLWGKVFVHPKLSLRPGEDGIHPEWIPPDDQTFIWKWIRGGVNDSGESLSAFSASVQG